MANPINQLPDECKQLIKGYASDRSPPSPTALLMKQLRFEYQNEANIDGIYLPYRLMITTMPPTRFMNRSYEVPTIVNDDYIRRYHLADFLPSYWSVYASTFDEVYNDREDVERRLQWKQYQ